VDQREWDYGARLPRERRAAESWSLDNGPENPDSSQDPPKWQSITDTGSLQPSPEAVAWAERADQWAQQPSNLPERQTSQWGDGQVSRWSEVVPTGNLPADGVGWRTETAEWRATSARWRQTTEWRASSGSHGWRTTTEAWQTGDANVEGFTPPAAPPTGGPLAISGSTQAQSDPYSPGGYAGDDRSGGGQQTDGSYQTESYSPPPAAGQQQPAAPWQQSSTPAAPPWPQSAPAAPWQQPGGAAAWQQGLPSPPPWETPGGSAWSPFGAADDGRHLVREDDRAQWRQSAAGAAGLADPSPSVGRRRAPESDQPGGGSGWSSRSEADDWAGYTDTGSMQRFGDPAQAESWGARDETPSWRDESGTPDWRDRTEAPGRREPETPSWRDPAETPSWRDPQASPGAGNWRGPQTPPSATSWRDSQAPSGGGSWRDPQALSGGREPASGDWRDPQSPGGARRDPQAPRRELEAGDWRDPQTTARGESGGWRDPEAPPRREPGSDWRTDTSTTSWRDERGETPGRRDERGEVEPRRAAPSWRDAPADEPDWRTESRAGTEAPSWRTEDDRGRAAERRDRAAGTTDWRTPPNEENRDDTEVADWRTQTSTSGWRTDPDPEHDWRTDTRSRAEAPDWRTDTRSRGEAPDWRRERDDRREPDSGSWSRGEDPRSDSWRRGAEPEAPSWRRDQDEWRRGEPAADPWAPSASDTGVMPASWQEPRTDTGSWRTPAAEPYSPPRRDDYADDDREPYGRRGRADRYEEPYGRRAEIEAAPRRRAEIEPPNDDWDDEDDSRPGGTDGRRPEVDPRTGRSDRRREPAGDPRGQQWQQETAGDPRGAEPRSAPPWSADPRGADPRGADPRGADPRAAVEPRMAEAATEIRPPIDWRQAERDDAAQSPATYRDGDPGDWRRELAASSDLADGESRRYATADFVPFKSPTAGSASVPALQPASAPPQQAAARVDELTTTGTGRWQDPPDTQWPPRGAVSYDSAATGSYERRPVSTLPTTSGRQNSLLEPDEDEIEESTGGPLAAVGYTVIWYGVPLVLFVVYLLVFSRGQQTHALSTLASAAPQFGLSLVLSMLVAVGLRWASGSWKAASVGLAAAVMGGGLATVLTSAITGNSLS
jgi:hypothetical protein